MDLTEQTTLYTDYVTDTLTDIVSLTFRATESGPALGTIELESLKMRALMESLRLVAKEFHRDDEEGQVKQLTTMDKLTRKAIITFK